MKNKFLVLVLALVLVFSLSACSLKKNEENNENGTPNGNASAEQYSYNFELAAPIPTGEENAFINAIKKRMSVFGYPDAEVMVTGASSFKVNFKPVTGVIFIDSDYKQFMLNTPTFEIRTRDTDENLVLTPEETQAMNTYNAAAKEKAQNLLDQVLADPTQFADIAKTNSEDTGSASNGGAYKGVSRGQFVTEYETVVFDKLKVGEIYPELVETQYGYHIIKKDAENGEGDTMTVDTSHILIAKQTEAKILAQREWLVTGLNGMFISTVNPVQQAESSYAFQILFNEEGSTKLADITGANVNKPIAIFIDGVGIGAPTVQNQITNGELVITGDFTQDTVIAVAQRLASGAIHAAIRLPAKTAE